MPDNPVERRRAKRKDLNLKGSFKIKDDAKYTLHLYKEPVEINLVDISLLGCGITAAHYLPKGLILSIRLRDFPVSGDAKETKDIEFEGRVRSCVTTPDRANRIGIEFSSIGKEPLNFVKSFLERSHSPA